MCRVGACGCGRVPGHHPSQAAQLHQPPLGTDRGGCRAASQAPVPGAGASQREAACLLKPLVSGGEHAWSVTERQAISKSGMRHPAEGGALLEGPLPTGWATSRMECWSRLTSQTSSPQVFAACLLRGAGPAFCACCSGGFLQASAAWRRLGPR